MHQSDHPVRSGDPDELVGVGADRPGPPRGNGQRVLIGASDPGDSELLATTLGLAGYRYVTAADGAELMAHYVQWEIGRAHV